MRANPGGQIPPSDVVGRDELIRDVWRVLERQSVVLTAERRIGKTCIVKKMVAEAPTGSLAVYHDVEGLRRPLEFVERIFHDVRGYLSTVRRTAERVRLFLADFGGLEISNVLKLPENLTPHWKTLLTKVVEDLVEQQEARVIFFWDEIPLMLYNISKADGETAAMELLDVLRSLRQMHERFRMVFTGSIGLDNVIASLKRAGYANDPTNDMHRQDVPPLSQGHAEELARRLLEGEAIQTEDPIALAGIIATSVDRIPYFIHHVIDRLASSGLPATAQSVREIVTAALVAAEDPWDLRHYRERIETYYSKDEIRYAMAVLDCLAAHDHPLSFADLFGAVKADYACGDHETCRVVITLLERDHYVLQEPETAQFRFRYPLLKRYWATKRGLKK